MFIPKQCLLVLVVVIHVSCVQAYFGPPYPVTGSWFKERYSTHEWNSTLHKYSIQGGDTILTRAPGLKIRTRDEIKADVDFEVSDGVFKLVLS